MPLENKSEAFQVLADYLALPNYLSLDTDKLRLMFEACALASNENSLPNGVILGWNKEVVKIPEGWLLCDGLNGTPDLSGEKLIYIIKIHPKGIEPTLKQP